jgi:hypothetical protein
LIEVGVEESDGADTAGRSGLLALPTFVLDELAQAVPRLVERTKAEADLARRLASHLPCIGGLLGPGTAPHADDRVEDLGPVTHETTTVDVLSVVADHDGDEDDDETAGDAEVERAVSGSGAADAEPEVTDGVDVPAEADLPVQDYDSLAASQVVPRLASLSDEELASVGAYERAHRNRQTILNKVKQLQAR